MNQELIDKYLQDAEPLFLEIGAFNGINWSPIVPLIDMGWHGIMVEPNPKTFELLRANRGENPKLQLVNAAIGSQAGEGVLYEGGSLSTLKMEKLELYNSLSSNPGWHVHLDPAVSHPCQILTLDQLLEREELAGRPFRPSVVSIDAEGSELDVLAGYSLTHRPRLFIIETHEQHPEQRLAADFPQVNAWFLSHGYLHAGADYTNTIYLDSHCSQ